MSCLHPIEPLLHLPEADAHVDVRSDHQRRVDTLSSEDQGLAQLVRVAGTPVGAFAGVQAGIWAPTGKPAIYLVREDYMDRSGVERTRHCVIAALDPEESTFRPAAVADREAVDLTVSHIRQSGADPAGVVAVYRDEEHHLEKLIESRGNALPLTTLGPVGGVRYSIWALEDAEGEGIGQVISDCGGAVVGDLVLYRALLRIRDDRLVSSGSMPVVRFYNQRDFGVSFSALGRVYGNLASLDVNHAIAALHEHYDVEEIEIPSDGGDERFWTTFTDRIRSEGIAERAVGLFFRASRTAFLVKSGMDEVSLIGHENPPEVAARYDVEWIEKGILRRITSELDVEPLHVSTDPRTLARELESTGGEVAFIVNPPAKRFLTELASEEWRLPLDSLQIQPPIARGVFLVPLRPSRELLDTQ